VAIVLGRAGAQEYTDAVVQDSGVIAVRDRVEATADPAIREDEARLTVTLRDGQVLNKHVEHAVGSLARPMTDSELEAKVHGLSDEILGRGGADRLIDLCWSVDRLPDAGDLPRAAALV
jgi:2-methylcitrate dehydratase PrpD